MRENVDTSLVTLRLIDGSESDRVLGFKLSLILVKVTNHDCQERFDLGLAVDFVVRGYVNKDQYGFIWRLRFLIQCQLKLQKNE